MKVQAQLGLCSKTLFKKKKKKEKGSQRGQDGKAGIQ
jgi:hypothetical protein